MTAEAERYLEAQAVLLEVLRADDRRAKLVQLDRAYAELRKSPTPEPALVERMRSMGALLDRAAKERRAALERELGRTRLALELVEVRGLGYRDAAAVLEIRVENFKMVVCRARKKIFASIVRVLGTRSP